ncbi:NADH-quinone oxidoreductase subunit NuoH, partial [Candidatus Poribacteria bacterium]|nr:NADH-quinone oxidoreductase subunit NuoH [Candidatus Poribacteria bacterium]
MMLPQIIAALIKIVFLVLFILAIVPVLVLAERKVSAWIQDRHGPNRVGPWGLLQPIADGVKFLLKEDIVPGQVDRRLYIAAPALILIPAFMTGAVIPFAKAIPADGLLGRLLSAASWAPDGIPFQIANINIGVLYFIAITSLGIYGVILAGWASNNKYALLGGLRASAQMISYELSMGLAILSVLLVAGSLNVADIVAKQTEAGSSWFVFFMPVAWFIFTVTAFAETNRLPFDLAECEQELVAGYHTEYSSMKFAMFFLAEYGNMAIGSCLNVCLFFGGYTLFGLEKLVPWWGTLLIFLAKVAFFLFVFIWVRWTLPRFRYDQVMALGWKMLLPV